MHVTGGLEAVVFDRFRDMQKLLEKVIRQFNDLKRTR